MAEVHKLIEEHGKQKAMDLFNYYRGNEVVHAAANYMEDESAGQEPGFFHNMWGHLGLPHKQPKDNPRAWTIGNEQCQLTVESGIVYNPDGTELLRVGIPYGSYARLLLIYMQTEAIQNNSRIIELGGSLRGFLNKLDINYGGRTGKMVKSQIHKLVTCKLNFRHTLGQGMVVSNQSIVDIAYLNNGDFLTEAPRFPDTLRLSEMYFEKLINNQAMLDMSAVRYIHNNTRALDVYLWLAFRLAYIKDSVDISWKSLAMQFGSSVTELRNFKSLFQQDLRLATAVYPQAKVALTPRGVTLYPSPPPVNGPRIHAVRPVPKVAKQPAEELLDIKLI